MSVKFNYKTLEDLKKDCQQNNINISFSEDLSVLSKNLEINGRMIPNRFVIQPMEGFDSNDHGAPGELTFRRYQRYARGGAGLIWFEATAVQADGRTNPHQVILNKKTESSFSELVKTTKETARGEFGDDHEPFCVLQITHSGRFSQSDGFRKPLIVVHDPVFDKVVGIDESYPVLTDKELNQIQNNFVEAAKLAYIAGFDAVDVKSCHKYLISELLGARNRSGKYGGSYENRTRFLKEIIERIREEAPELIVGVRLNIFDAVNTENSWGVNQGVKREVIKVDLTEPKRLVKELQELGLAILNTSASTPYYRPYITRPYDQPVSKGYEQPEHPLKGVERLFMLAEDIQKEFPKLPVVGSGYSWLRQFGGAAAAANIIAGRHTLVGFGRQAFAYPYFARDLMEKGKLDPKKCCITCSKCSQLMIWGSKTGCVVRDADLYANVYKEGSAVLKNK